MIDYEFLAKESAVSELRMGGFDWFPVPTNVGEIQRLDM